MLTDNQKKWVEALRSGEFKQTEGALCARGRHCCLGVGCELAIRSGVTINRDDRQTRVAFDNFEDVLPDQVIKFLGLKSDDGHFIAAGHIHKTLAAINDAGTSFLEIADIIESEPEGLFVK